MYDKIDILTYSAIYFWENNAIFIYENITEIVAKKRVCFLHITMKQNIIYHCEKVFFILTVRSTAKALDTRHYFQHHNTKLVKASLIFLMSYWLSAMIILIACPSFRLWRSDLSSFHPTISHANCTFDVFLTANADRRAVSFTLAE